MADAKISALPAAGSVVAADILPFTNILGSITQGIGMASIFTSTAMQTPSIVGGTITRMTIVSPSVTGTLNAGVVELTGSLNVIKAITISGAASALGYADGSGGTVTQSIGGRKEIAVALNRAAGMIIMSNSMMQASAITSMLFGNSVIGINDNLVLNYIGNGLGTTNMRSYALSSSVVSPGAALINIKSNNNYVDTSSIFIGFSVIKGAIT